MPVLSLKAVTEAGLTLHWLLLCFIASTLLVAAWQTMTHFSPSEYALETFDLDWRSHYDVLNVSDHASAKDIRKAYHMRILELHPDKTNNSVAASREFRKVVYSYEILSDYIDRCVYDNSLITGDSARLEVCMKAKVDIARAQADQDWKDYLAERKASRWQQEWRDITEETDEAEEEGLVPLMRETVFSVIFVIDKVRRGVMQ